MAVRRAVRLVFVVLAALAVAHIGAMASAGDIPIRTIQYLRDHPETQGLVKVEGVVAAMGGRPGDSLFYLQSTTREPGQGAYGIRVLTRRKDFSLGQHPVGIGDTVLVTGSLLQTGEAHAPLALDGPAHDPTKQDLVVEVKVRARQSPRATLFSRELFARPSDELKSFLGTLVLVQGPLRVVRTSTSPSSSWVPERLVDVLLVGPPLGETDAVDTLRMRIGALGNVPTPELQDLLLDARGILEDSPDGPRLLPRSGLDVHLHPRPATEDSIEHVNSYVLLGEIQTAAKDAGETAPATGSIGFIHTTRQLRTDAEAMIRHEMFSGLVSVAASVESLQSEVQGDFGARLLDPRPTKSGAGTYLELRYARLHEYAFSRQQTGFELYGSSAVSRWSVRPTDGDTLRWKSDNLTLFSLGADLLWVAVCNPPDANGNNFQITARAGCTWRWIGTGSLDQDTVSRQALGSSLHYFWAPELGIDVEIRQLTAHVVMPFFVKRHGEDVPGLTGPKLLANFRVTLPMTTLSHREPARARKGKGRGFWATIHNYFL